MRRKIRLSLVAIALGSIAFFIIGMTSKNAQNYGEFNNHHLRGYYASQLTGTMNFPEGYPLSPFNGPYALTGRVYADGNGNARGTVIESYNGMLVNYSWEGTYEVNPDGTVLIVLIWEMGGVESQIQMFGVLCENGKQMRLMHVGATYAPNMVGTTITGSWIRQ